MRNVLSLCCVLVLGPLAAGCGSGSTKNNNNNPPVNEGPDMTEPADLYTIPPYPDQPWGVVVGATMYPIKASGYNLDVMHTDSSAIDYTEIQLAQIHFNPACKCLLLSESATWCPPCNAEQAELVAAVSEDPSLCVFEVLVDGPTPGVRATMEDVYNWTQKHQQNFPNVNANKDTYLHLPRPAALPTNVTIHPLTMKILEINAGLGPTTISDAKTLCAEQ